MFTAYAVVTSMTITANTFIVVADLIPCQFVLNNMARLGIPESRLKLLASLKAAGAVGLLLGLIGVPLIGVAAGIGLCIFFVGAIGTHLRAGDRSLALGFPGGFLLLALVTLALELAS
jgi:hypothetical protein